MPKRSSKKQGPEDVNEAAFRVTQEATGETQPQPERKKNPAAVALGRLGGLKGGKARAAKLTANAMLVTYAITSLPEVQSAVSQTDRCGRSR